MAQMTEELGLGLISAFKSQDFSDLTINCGKYSFNVHKVIVCAQSEYFKLACRKGTFKEGESGIIDLKATDAETSEGDESCDDPEAVMLMVHFFYHQNYAVEKVEFKGPSHGDVAAIFPEDGGNFMMHAKVFATAVKYQVPGLIRLAAKKFGNAVGANYEHDDFADVIQTVYNSTPEEAGELRSIVTETLVQHKELLKKPEIMDSIKSVNGLACELLSKSWASDM